MSLRRAWWALLDELTLWPDRKQREIRTLLVSLISLLTTHLRETRERQTTDATVTAPVDHEGSTT